LYKVELAFITGGIIGALFLYAKKMNLDTKEVNDLAMPIFKVYAIMGVVGSAALIFSTRRANNSSKTAALLLAASASIMACFFILKAQQDKLT
jgi:uncharacterized membrane protein